VNQLIVVCVIVKIIYWYTVVYLESERRNRVVYYCYVAKRLSKNSQVFNAATVVVNARLSVESRGNQLVVWVNHVYYRICVLLLTRGEYDDLEKFCCSLKAFSGVRSYVDAYWNRIFIRV